MTMTGDKDAIKILRVAYASMDGEAWPYGPKTMYAGDVLYDARQYLADRQRYERIAERESQ